MDAAIARHTVAMAGGKLRDYMPWPREEAVPMDGEQLLTMVKGMRIKLRNR